jgi:hypothetical protein
MQVAASAVVTIKAAQIASLVLLPPNVNRKGSPSIYYDGAAVMYLLVGPGLASNTNFTLKLGAGLLHYYEPPTQNYIGQISAAWSCPVGHTLITEFI